MGTLKERGDSRGGTGDQAVTVRPVAGQPCSLLPEIDILQGQFDLHPLDVLNCVLKIVPLLAGHAEFVALDRDLDLQLGILQLLDQLSGQLLVDALPDDDGLADRVARSLFRVLEVERAGVEFTAGEVGADQFVDLFQLEHVIGLDGQRLVLAVDLAGAALEIEAGFDFAGDVRERVIDLGEVRLGNDVETRHDGEPLSENFHPATVIDASGGRGGPRPPQASLKIARSVSWRGAGAVRRREDRLPAWRWVKCARRSSAVQRRRNLAGRSGCRPRAGRGWCWACEAPSTETHSVPGPGSPSPPASSW